MKAHDLQTVRTQSWSLQTDRLASDPQSAAAAVSPEEPVRFKSRLVYESSDKLLVSRRLPDTSPLTPGCPPTQK